MKNEYVVLIAGRRASKTVHQSVEEADKEANQYRARIQESCKNPDKLTEELNSVTVQKLLFG